MPLKTGPDTVIVQSHSCNRERERRERDRKRERERERERCLAEKWKADTDLFCTVSLAMAGIPPDVLREASD